MGLSKLLLAYYFNRAAVAGVFKIKMSQCRRHFSGAPIEMRDLTLTMSRA